MGRGSLINWLHIHVSLIKLWVHHSTEVYNYFQKVAEILQMSRYCLSGDNRHLLLLMEIGKARVKFREVRIGKVR